MSLVLTECLFPKPVLCESSAPTGCKSLVFKARSFGVIANAFFHDMPERPKFVLVATDKSTEINGSTSGREVQHCSATSGAELVNTTLFLYA